VTPPAPTILWVGSPNHFAGRAGHVPMALVIHTMGGTLAGTDAWFANPASQVSAHYGVSLAGVVHQYVALEDGAWSNGDLEAGNRWPGPAGVNPNYLTCSIETEDLGNAAQPVTDAQFASVLAVGRLVLTRYPSITLLVSHSVISPHSRPNCPGSRWIASGRFADLAAELGLTADW
jgi:N-acetylmuramoyl-L-alanine amidase